MIFERYGVAGDFPHLIRVPSAKRMPSIQAWLLENARENEYRFRYEFESAWGSAKGVVVEFKQFETALLFKLRFS